MRVVLQVALLSPLQLVPDTCPERARAARPAAAAPEPKRGKAHWDLLLEEMAWLAKEFSK